ncbi:MAG TPA: hypothetical protein VG077_08830 [Verrucomicrobiae bacterium]|nr:hypothetical protein [Verrucomicrobiae bacterium]
MKPLSGLNLRLLASALLVFGLATRTVASAPLVTVTLDTENPGLVIPADFEGLSFEASQLLPGPGGIHYFRRDNHALIHLFHTLGIKSLRLGGNTADRDARKLPDEADLDSLFAFAKAAGVKIIYCLRLHGGDPQADARTAKYIMDRYASQMDCFSIGQEPSSYPKPYSYSDYEKDWRKFADTIIAAVPDVKFCGPSVHKNPAWARQFIADFGQASHVILITEHFYPGGAGNKVPAPEVGRDCMLSDNFVKSYETLYNGFVPAALSDGLPYRLEEANNYFNGGAKGVSDTFAAALWGLDFMHWWAEHGAKGVNFHTGDFVSANYRLEPAKYTAFFSTRNGYVSRPLAYGIKAFDLSGHGRVVRVELSSGSSRLAAYAVLGNDNDLYVTLINQEHGADAQTLTVAVRPSRTRFKSGQILYLIAPDHNVAAISGETLGGTEIEVDGNWNGKWTLLKPPENDTGTFTVQIPAVCAAIVKLLPMSKP